MSSSPFDFLQYNKTQSNTTQQTMSGYYHHQQQHEQAQAVEEPHYAGTSWSWLSDREQMRRAYHRLRNTAHYLGLDASPFFPATAGELVARLAEAKEEEVELLRAQLARMETAIAAKKMEGGEEKEEVKLGPLMHGRVPTDGLSAVLALSNPFAGVGEAGSSRGRALPALGQVGTSVGDGFGVGGGAGVGFGVGVGEGDISIKEAPQAIRNLVVEIDRLMPGAGWEMEELGDEEEDEGEGEGEEKAAGPEPEDDEIAWEEAPWFIHRLFEERE
ncbi:hypothetical protein B0T19DRAFT_444663 [Cercophora scortea]|uniref:Uncharacterized protein n=1 Tax=Cercophora scortea TaxID=314031 RepID=A0AAE0M645_9PEZI|nr:hypothetical protein B0T19DRAFT_444663 [Cercophora scortea]